MVITYLKLKKIENMNKLSNTIIYSCSGCSNVAQLANKIAVKIDREKIAKMSCIAGVGGDVPSLVKVAKNAKKIFVIDGCNFSCARKCLERHDKTPNNHIILTELNLSKNMHSDFSDEEFHIKYEEIKNILTNTAGSI